MTGFSGLKALFITTALKKDGRKGHARLLMGASSVIMEKDGVAVEHLHMPDHQVPPGVCPDMTGQGRDRDDWPAGCRFDYENPDYRS